MREQIYPNTFMKHTNLAAYKHQTAKSSHRLHTPARPALSVLQPVFYFARLHGELGTSLLMPACPLWY